MSDGTANGRSSGDGASEPGRSGGWLRRRIRRIDDAQRTRPWLAVPFAVVRKFGDDQAGRLAALIAYYGFFSVFPLLLVFVTVLGFVLGSDSHATRSVLTQFPIIGTELRKGSLQGSGVALIVGILTALWAGTAVVTAMQNAMNGVWNVPIKRTPNTFRQLPRSLVMLPVFGIAALVSSLLSGFAGAGSGLVLRVMGMIVAFVVNVGLYEVAFRVLTVEDVHWRTVLPGAVVGGAFWTVLQVFGGLYVAHQVNGASQTYGSFALVIGLLSWMYLAAQGSLLAAEVNVVLARHLWPRRLIQDTPLTGADRRALSAYGEEEERIVQERVRVSIDDAPAAPTTTPRSAEA